MGEKKEKEEEKDQTETEMMKQKEEEEKGKKNKGVRGEERDGEEGEEKSIQSKKQPAQQRGPCFQDKAGLLLHFHVLSFAVLVSVAWRNTKSGYFECS